MTIRELIDAAHLKKDSFASIRKYYDFGDLKEDMPYHCISGTIQSIIDSGSASEFLDKEPYDTILEAFIPTIIGSNIKMGHIPRIIFRIVRGGQDNASSKADL